MNYFLCKRIQKSVVYVRKNNKLGVSKIENKYIREGFVPFGRYQTYYRVVGKKTKNPPLILLHGGPGSTHNYFEMLDDIAEMSQRQLIMYDQLGCGYSSIPDDERNCYKAGTWLDELENLITFLGLKEFHLLGQSWGGMLAIMYLCDRDASAAKSVVLSSTLSSAKLWAKELHRLIKYLPNDEQEAIKKAEETQNFKNPAYLKANAHFMKLYASDDPKESHEEVLRRPKKSGTESYTTAWGPNEYTPQGNLSDYEYTAKLSKIEIPALIMSGINDLSTPLVAKTMADALPNSEWHLFANSRHMPFVEENKKYMKILTEWLKNND